ncbi:SusD/RagB family nutrient-binding outer membrane lipoprotein [Flavobacterium sp.]|uniref:SusD/RagB family nutrient-binding outer membrane lipoprotein n=1 Tax=Flavobacterium sp. TaxID=239 RepID=UPI002638A69A|nr:SusD/RagB family nutrient-binding outer membrane lipoprotein [Flavobacterium sp.]
MKMYKKLLLSLFAAGTVVSCTDNFFDVNDSQNNPVSSTPELSLPVAQKYSVDILQGGYNSYNTLGNLWSYTWAAGGDFIYFTDETAYILSSSFRPSMFDNVYLLPLRNYHEVEINANENQDNYKAIAKIMKAFHYQYLVDAYGDIPYSEALQGGTNVQPAYDDAQAIYNDLIVQLTAAQALINNADSNDLIPTSNQDVMCGGDMAKWNRFANTLKLRILLRQSEIGVTDYSSVNNGIGFLAANENVTCNPGYVNDVNRQNPFYAAFGFTVAGDPAANKNATRVTPFIAGNSTTLGYPTNLLTGDPRKQALLKPVGTTTNYVGIDQNRSGGLNSASLSTYNDFFISSATQSGMIMSGFESAFLQAEAVERGFITGDKAALYKAGIEANFAYLGASLGTYDTSYPVDDLLTPVNESILNIARQKYISLMHINGFENYCELRRINSWGAIVPVAPDASQPTRPVRLPYPASEYNNNPNNVPNQTNTTYFTDKIFWDN